MNDIDMSDDWRSGLSAEEIKEIYEHENEWINHLSDEEINEYYNQLEYEDSSLYIKRSEDDDNWIRIDDKSILHPDNPYYQKIIPRWDWIEITGEINESDLLILHNNLISFKELESYSNNNYHVYNVQSKGWKYNSYSNFRVLIQILPDKIMITMSIASTLLNQENYTENWIKNRLLLKQDTIRIKRLDLSFLILLDVSNVNVKLKYAKRKQVIMSDNMETETITLGSRKSDLRVNLYNKKIQLDEKRKTNIEGIKNLYNLEFTLKGEALKKWRSIIHERLTFHKDILSHYKPTQKSDFPYMYLYLNDPKLFKAKLSKKDKRRMDDHLRKLRKQLTQEKIDFDLEPLISEQLYFNHDMLTKKVKKLTGIDI